MKTAEEQTYLENALANLSHVLGGPVTYNGVQYQSTSNSI